ncbi:hypothetical protein SCAR479_06320 [Seiridium cardinale]|uniref:Uncharacterized protein n=1 Tax=Seiridium cardinale TaxID=138064 RepID=A0ABR2XTD0_9PEZI
MATGISPDPNSERHETSGLRQRRPSSSAADAVITKAKELEGRVEHALLLLWDDLPSWRRDNVYILSGYRSVSNSYLGSIKSLFWLHNESVNIWTHLLGSLVFPLVGLFLYHIIAPRYPTASTSDVLVFSCFFGGAAACLGMSATFHMLCNHSPGVAKWGNKLDYSGIVALIVGSYVPALYYGLFCEPRLMVFYLYGICLLGVGCGIVSWVERFRTPKWRPYRAMMFVGLGVSGVLPVCQGIAIYGYHDLEKRMGLNWVIFQGFLYIFGAFLYAVRWPERSAPGTFDIWGKYSLEVAVDLLSDVSIEVFRASDDPKVKRELLPSMKSVRQRQLSLDVVGWDDQANLETLAEALAILSGVIPNGGELWRAAHIISSSRFSKLCHFEEVEEEGGMTKHMVLKSKIATERMWVRIAQTKGN